MCGIIGYVGKQPAAPILIEGLKRMEYRGYDSAGIATIEDNSLQVVKKKGRIAILEHSIAGFENTNGNSLHIGIGHTRWATHGPPSEINAHPHTSATGKIALIHNGIIENYNELRKALSDQGHVFQSATDTEVLAHLIEANYKDDLEEAVIRSLRLVEGTYGIAVINVDQPDRIVVGRKGSPLVVGLGDNENFIASDLAAMVKHTRDVIFLEDGEVGTLTLDGFIHKNLESALISRRPTHIDFFTRGNRKRRV